MDNRSSQPTLAAVGGNGSTSDCRGMGGDDVGAAEGSGGLAGFAANRLVLGQNLTVRGTPRSAVAAMFLLNGALFGTWASRIPVFVERFDLSPERIGLLLLGMASGAIATFPLAGRLSDRLGASNLSRRTAVAYVLSLALLSLSSSVWMLGASLIIFGATQGMLDVAMNSWGAEVEQHQDRPLMSSFHAVFSLGAGLGAAWGFLAVQLGLGVLPHFVLTGAVLGTLTLTHAAVPWSSQRAEGGHGVFALPKGPLILVGLVAFCATLGEGAMADWSAIFLHISVGTTEAQSALGYAAFSAAMLVVRLAGDGAVRRWGPTRTARLSGLLVVLGVLVAIEGTKVLTVLAGFALMGTGYAVIAPLAFSRAATDPVMSPGLAIASVATLGYGGLLLGPALIGFIAESASLQWGFAVLGVLAVFIVFFAASLDAPGRSR